MKFKNDYWASFDEEAKRLQLDPNQIGISHGIGELGEGLKANIFRGASVVELGFMGVGKGFRSQPTGGTPESYGRSEREEIKQLARINEIQLSTHASPNLPSISGFGERGFSEQQREMVLNELKRTVDFAADTAEGGAVVVHTGEFPRPVSEADEKFKAYDKEKEKAPVYFVDDTTGEIVGSWRKDKKIPIPNEENPFNKETGEGNFEYLTYDEIVEKNKDKERYKGKAPEQIFFTELKEREKEVQLAEQKRYQYVYEDNQKQLEKLERLQREYGQMKEARGEEEAKAFLFEGITRGVEGISKEATINPEKFLQERIKETERQKQSYKEGALGHARAVATIKEEIENIVPIQQYGLDKSSETLAKAGMYAYEVEKKKELKRSLFIAPENFLQEQYGGHPKEYREIIVQSRDKMADMLMEKKGMDKEDAEKVARDHIKGTFDIGHFNMWRKYYQGEDKDFDKWVKDQVSSLVKDGIIGHVHLTDNFGYQDEHLSPGEGNAPIQEFLEVLKEEEYKGKIIAEPGGQKQSDIHKPWLDTLRAAGSPIYRIDGISRSWTDIDQSYFGRTQSPNFLVGDYAPSKDWTLWSETPLE